MTTSKIKVGSIVVQPAHHTSGQLPGIVLHICKDIRCKNNIEIYWLVEKMAWWEPEYTLKVIVP